MWARGFVDEVAALADDGLREGPTASRALGYAQVLAQLDGDAHRGRGAGADGRHHPPVRPPAALLVPPRRRASPGSTRPAPTCVDAVGRADRRPYDRRVTARAPACSSGTAPRTTSSCCPTPTAPSGRSDRLDAATWCARLCDRRAGLGGDGVLRVVRRVHVPDAADVLGDDLGRVRRGSWTTATPTARTPRCAATASGCSCTCWSPRACSTARRARPACWSAPAAARAGSAPPPTAATGWTWARRARSARARPTVDGQVFDGLAVSMGNPHLACLTDVDVDTLDLTGQPEFDAGALPRGRERRADQRPGAGQRTSGCGCTSAAWGRPARAAPAPAPPPTRPWSRPAADAGTVVVDVPGGRLSVRVDRRDDGAHRPRGGRGGRRAHRGVARRLSSSGLVGLVRPGLRLVGRGLGLVARPHVALAGRRALAGVLAAAEEDVARRVEALGSRPGSSRSLSAPRPLELEPVSLMGPPRDGVMPSALPGRSGANRRPGAGRSSSSSGRSRMPISGLERHGQRGQTAARRRRSREWARCPSQLPSAPPSSAPSGMRAVHDEADRGVHPARAARGGHSRCRKLTWVML